MPIDEDYLTRFKADLAVLSASAMFDRYVNPDECRGLVDVDHLALRERISARFQVDLRSVVIVGSAKIGFTLVTKKARRDQAARPMFSPFYEGSDVDVAIISDRIFDEIWKDCLLFWHSSGYSDDYGYWRDRGVDFRSYHFRGWMRPDKLPTGGRFNYRNEWFDFFLQLTSERAAGDYPVKAGVYREEFFLRTYQHVALEQCRGRMAVI